MNGFSYSKSIVDGSVLGAPDVLRRNNVRIIGQGQRTLLLCNGFGYNQHLWNHLAPALAAQYRVVLFDHVGSGGSVRQAYDAQKYNCLNGYAQDMVEICQALHLHDAVLVGHSVGATIALLAASAAPEHFGQVVLLTPSPCYINEPGYYGGFERENLLQMLDAMQTDYYGWAYQFADLLLGAANPPALSEELSQLFSQADAAVVQQFARVTFLSDNRADVPRLRLPTLVVLCQQDVVAPTEVGEYLVSHLSDAQMVTLRTTGHCPQLSAPLETLVTIQNFVRAAA